LRHQLASSSVVIILLRTYKTKEKNNHISNYSRITTAAADRKKFEIGFNIFNRDIKVSAKGQNQAATDDAN